jgi:hypothetical protein
MWDTVFRIFHSKVFLFLTLYSICIHFCTVSKYLYTYVCLIKCTKKKYVRACICILHSIHILYRVLLSTVINLEPNSTHLPGLLRGLHIYKGVSPDNALLKICILAGFMLEGEGGWIRRP